jgi:hypothetical protein
MTNDARVSLRHEGGEERRTLSETEGTQSMYVRVKDSEKCLYSVSACNEQLERWSL